MLVFIRVFFFCQDLITNFQGKNNSGFFALDSSDLRFIFQFNNFFNASLNFLIKANISLQQFFLKKSRFFPSKMSSRIVSGIFSNLLKSFPALSEASDQRFLYLALASFDICFFVLSSLELLSMSSSSFCNDAMMLFNWSKIHWMIFRIKSKKAWHGSLVVVVGGFVDSVGLVTLKHFLMAETAKNLLKKLFQQIYQSYLQMYWRQQEQG